ncbi:Protein transport protein S9 plasma membrane t-SNARE [Coemansia erecta]|uniref:Protein transport protein S9 plasma membrane t-SNARE n=1 Tax=Coemansia erecta TaxID=147472 RepID=A0A9W7XX50_9FUNG|nr:Protein transport protein S9 plasma membrane t-SNARE [Coemansia erecta]
MSSYRNTSGTGGSYGSAAPSSGYSSPSGGARAGGGSGGGYSSKYGSGNSSKYASPGGGNSGSSSGTRLDTRGYAAASREGRSQYGPSKYGSGGYQQQQQQQQRYGNLDDDDDEDIDAIKSKINEVKKDTLDSTRRSLRTLQQAEEVGTATLTKLGQQSEQLHGINRKLEMANIQAENSVDETSKLRTLNKSIFHMHFNKPFSGKKRREMELAKIEAEQERQRLAREREQQGKSESRQRVQEYAGRNGPKFRGPSGVMDVNSGNVVQSRGGAPQSRGERSRYTFEDEDPELEDEIDDNMDEISAAVSRLKGLSLATKRELDSQVNPLRRIGEVSDRTSDNLGIANFHLAKVTKK